MGESKCDPPQMQARLNALYSALKEACGALDRAAAIMTVKQLGRWEGGRAVIEFAGEALDTEKRRREK